MIGSLAQGGLYFQELPCTSQLKARRGQRARKERARMESCAILVKDLDRWLRNLGWGDCGVQLVHEAGAQLPPCSFRAVAKSCGVRRGAILVAVPEEAFMDCTTAARCSVVGPLVGHLTPWQALCLHLLWERALGNRSFWGPYIAVLPSEAQAATMLPLIWSEELSSKCLGRSQLAVKREREVGLCGDDFGALMAAGAGELLLPGRAGSLEPVVTEASTRWAAAMLLSRAFYFGGGVHLVPWADMLDHSSAAGAASCLSFDTGRRIATLRAHTSYAADEQVFDSYGPSLTCSQLFLRYGFVDASNRNHGVELQASILGPVRGPENVRLLEEIGLPPDGASFTITPAGPDDTLLAWARAAVATGVELQRAGWSLDSPRSFKLAGRVMASFSCPVSQANELEVLRRLSRTCHKLLDAIPYEETGHKVGELPLGYLYAKKALQSERMAVVGTLNALIKRMQRLDISHLQVADI